MSAEAESITVAIPQMTVVRGWPPNGNSILLAFPHVRATPGVIFCYGATIFVPYADLKLPKHLLVHEGVHGIQQAKVGGPERWWRLYIDDPEFRLLQEVQAYRMQWQYACRTMSQRPRTALLGRICYDLSSRLYGSMVSTSEARKLITVAL